MDIKQTVSLGTGFSCLVFREGPLTCKGSHTGLKFKIIRSAYTVFMYFVWITEQTAIISLYNINWSVCITETECVYCAVRTGCLSVIADNTYNIFRNGIVKCIPLNTSRSSLYHKSGMWKVYLRFQRDTQTAVIGDKTLQMESQILISIRGISYICRLVTMIAHNASLTELRLICAMAGRL